MNNRGFAAIFIVIILAIVIAFISGVFIYMTSTINSELKTQFQKIDDTGERPVNYTKTLDDTLGKTAASITALRWISGFLILGLIFAMFIGSYLVTIRPVFFVFYVFIMIIAVVLSAQISNAYERVIADPTLAATFATMPIQNFIIGNFVMFVLFVGFIGGIIMFINMQRGFER